jgi:hypothetical protein
MLRSTHFVVGSTEANFTRRKESVRYARPSALDSFETTPQRHLRHRTSALRRDPTSTTYHRRRLTSGEWGGLRLISKT